MPRTVFVVRGIFYKIKIGLFVRFFVKMEENEIFFNEI